MDLIDDLGALALGSRLKRLSDRLMQDGIRVYRDAGVEFEPRWFPVFSFLKDRGPSAMTEIAAGLGISHVSVNQVARELLGAELVAAYKDTRDKRRRVLALTRKGKAIIPDLLPVWTDIRGALEDVVAEAGPDLLASLSRLEAALERQSFHARFAARHMTGPRFRVEFFRPELAGVFRELNIAWIERYFQVEDADRKVLDDPWATIVQPGGEIVFVRELSSGTIRATCALVNHGEGTAELAKMTVDESARGTGLGEYVARATLERATMMGFSKVFLETNSSLAPALGLYRKLGFVRKPSPFESDYARADVYMELMLGSA